MPSILHLSSDIIDFKHALALRTIRAQFVVAARADWGGWYDHVKPPLVLNQYEIGFRVPMIVVSPYAKASYVSHTFYEFGSILKFIENTYGLSNIAPGATHIYADQFPGTGDLSDCFDFTQAPRAFHHHPGEVQSQTFFE